MRRNLVLAGLVIALSAASWAGLAHRADSRTPEPQSATPLQAPGADAFRTAERLTDITRLGSDVERYPLQELLELLEEKHQLHLVLDPRLIEARNNDGDVPLPRRPVTVPMLKRQRLDTLLGHLCMQLEANYLIYDDHILIAEDSTMRDRLGVLPISALNGFERVPVELITYQAQDLPLKTVLDQVRDRTQQTIVLSPQVGAAANQRVSLRLQNTPVEDALALIAEVAGLKATQKGKTHLLTTPKQARAIIQFPFDEDGPKLGKALTAEEELILNLSKGFKALLEPPASPLQQRLQQLGDRLDRLLPAAPANPALPAPPPANPAGKK